MPCRGKLYYRGIDVEKLVGGFVRGKRFGFEETVYLFDFRHAPKKRGVGRFLRPPCGIPHFAHKLCARYYFKSAQRRHDEHPCTQRSDSLFL